MGLHKFKLTLTATGAGCKVEMDGQPLRARAISVRVALNQVTMVTVEIPAELVEIEGEAYLDVTSLSDEVRALEVAGG